ncbi:MAG: putative 2-naphthoyl-CoA reductase beta subunit [bacterium]|nr:MAG: putative 2-naphthoyl-CoA reductase beta subunit [bacterium]
MTAKYPTRPLEYFAKMKELRRSIARDTFTAKERGKPVVMGGEVGFHALYAAFDAEVIPAMPTGREMRDLDWVIKLNQAAEVRGYGKDCCSTLRIALGAHFLGTFGLDAKTGEHLYPDVIVNMIICQGQIKSHQLHAEYLGIPNISIELPFYFQSQEIAKKYFIDQCHQAVEKLEKALGRKCDDEKLVEGSKRELRTRLTMAKIA